MRILLLGEYSNVHATLAEGLRSFGHEVVVASNGDFWKNYPRDIDLKRPNGRFGGLRLWLRILLHMHRFRGFDIVQIINPLFFEIKAERHFRLFDYLKRHNRKVVMCAFGVDYYWVTQDTKRLFRYGDFNIGQEERQTDEAMEMKSDWIGTAKEELSKYCAEKSDAIVTGLYEYDAIYQPLFPRKTTFIPFPIKPFMTSYEEKNWRGGKVRLFIGISRGRSAYKGTDIMLRAAQDVVTKYADKAELLIAEGVPFETYTQMMLNSDLILDQLYSYTPAMNALEAMNRGIICVGGGEPENYKILGEEELRPIINVEPNYNSVYKQLEDIILQPERIPELKRQGVEYIMRHHEYIKVAHQYESLYQGLLNS